MSMGGSNVRMLDKCAYAISRLDPGACRGRSEGLLESGRFEHLAAIAGATCRWMVELQSRRLSTGKEDVDSDMGSQRLAGSCSAALSLALELVLVLVPHRLARLIQRDLATCAGLQPYC